MTVSKNQKIIFDRALSLFICFIYIFSVSFVNNDFFRDRYIYASLYAENSRYILDEYSGYEILTNEPVFLYFNVFLSKIFSPEHIVYLYVFTIVSFSSILLWRFSGNFMIYIISLLILFFSPYLFHFQFVILRQSLATFIFLIPFIFVEKKILKYTIIFFAPFVHSSFFIIIAFYYAYVFLRAKFSLNKVLVIFFIASLIFNAVFFTVGTFLGFRQLNESHITGGVSVGGGAFILFAFVFLYIFKIYNYIKDDLYDFCLILTMFFLVTYFVIPVSGRMMSTIFFMILLVLVRSANTLNIVFLFFLLSISLFSAHLGYISNGSLNVKLDMVLDFILHLRWLF